MNKGVYYLARAVCRQWVLDGKPKASKSQVEQWAKLMIMLRPTQKAYHADIRRAR